MSKNANNKIALYCCENSSFKAFQALDDAAAAERVEVIPLPCSGKIEIGMVLKTLEAGYAGVLILGCPKDNCKFIRGNYRAEKRIRKLHGFLKAAGVSPEKVRIDFISSVDRHKCRQLIGEMTDRIFNPEGVKA